MRGHGLRAALWGGFLLLCAGCTGAPPANPGSLQAGLPPCPDTPNCAETAREADAEVGPFVLSERFLSASAAERLDELVAVVENEARTRVVDREGVEGPEGGLYLRAEATSRVFRFVDDLELRHRNGSDRLEVRSASRMGQSDLGVNRSRVDRLRHRLAEAGILQP